MTILKMDLHAKKKLLRDIPSGLYVIGLKAENDFHAFTASWLTQVSLKPPVVMLGVRSGGRSLRMIRKSKIFSINYIRKDNPDTVAHFFKPVVRDGHRLGHYHFHADKTGAPILDEAIGYLECCVKKIAGGFGDHAAVFAEIVNAKVKENLPPLVMADTAWHYGG